MAMHTEYPLRVDFAGGWLDVPRFAIPGEYVVNCAISPLVSLTHWPYEQRAGLGGSGAWSLLNGHNGIDDELDMGVGWQDPAVIERTGLCVWKSGPRPELDHWDSGDFLRGCMGLVWTGSPHDTPELAGIQRDYGRIAASGRVARDGVLTEDIDLLAEGVRLYYGSQIAEGMEPLPPMDGALAMKYCGGGYGGYALYLFRRGCRPDTVIPVEPYVRDR